MGVLSMIHRLLPSWTPLLPRGLVRYPALPALPATLAETAPPVAPTVKGGQWYLQEQARLQVEFTVTKVTMRGSVKDVWAPQTHSKVWKPRIRESEGSVRALMFTLYMQLAHHCC